jgi:hypothetical protein
MTYQLDTYRCSSPLRKNGGRNCTTASASAIMTNASTTSGNSAHSSGWLTPASTSSQPGTITAKFQRPNSQVPRRGLVTGRPVRTGTA